jgi:hypothetical protein
LETIFIPRDTPLLELLSFKEEGRRGRSNRSS